MEVHLAADRAGKKRILTAILAVADDGMADCRHVDAQLVGAARHRFQLDPRRTLACAVDHTVTRLGRRAVFLVDMHLLAAGARLLGERGVDHTFGQLRFADDQRPIDLARRVAGEALGETRRGSGRAGDQQHARGVLVEPVDEARTGCALVRHKGVEQPVDMLRRLAAALRGEAGRLVEHDGRGRLADHHVARLGDLFGRQCAGAGRGFARRGCILATGGNSQHLSGFEAVFRLGALAIDPDLPGPRPARDGGKADLRQIALEPAVQPDAVVILADGELADVVFGRIYLGHCTL